jgi:ATP-dependent DNA helicase RecQ
MEQLAGILKRYWGYDQFRPLQAEAMRAVLEDRDSLVVLPTGGGKSLCFQAPALALSGLAVVVSPLISLMKDQVDSLAECGVPAACVNSMLSAASRAEVARRIRAGELKLLYLAPERLMTERTLAFLKEVPVSFFAIDEAHCISDWGHDFRPEYRMLKELKGAFPGVAVHAYTATATVRVREDIMRELRLVGPEILVGSFDRPNLVYRAMQRGDLLAQVTEVIGRFPNQSGIVYCMRRVDVEALCEMLRAKGLQALPYHAGLGDEDRRRNQEAFINDHARIIVATVAFGMGIDKSDVRYVVHAAAPKSLESYQQESGRAGRDGLESECWLLYSNADFRTWRAMQKDLPQPAFNAALELLNGIDAYCNGVVCRHRALVEYFGQPFESENCGACDICLNELALAPDALVLGQKILSCVARLEERFGADYTAQVLMGSREQRILANGHDRLSTHGLLAGTDKRVLRNWIEQLVGQRFLSRSGEYGVLQITPLGRRALRGEVAPRLARPAASAKKISAAGRQSWEGVDRPLFEALRGLRRQWAAQRGLPPFVVMSDATLRDLARLRPTSLPRLLLVRGVGQKKAAEYGEDLLQAIAAHCRQHGLPADLDLAKVPAAEAAHAANSERPLNPALLQAYALFSQGKSVDQVQQATGRARSTTLGYLAQYIDANGVCDPAPWIAPDVFGRVRQACAAVGLERLRPLYDALNGAVDFDQLRIAVACLRCQSRIHPNAVNPETA